MVLGVDFDNTLACYDSVFHEVALEIGMLPHTDLRLTKQQVKHELHSADRHDDWTRLQGLVYGPEVGRACPFPGALAALERAREQGWQLFIVSHKTRRPVIGEPHDLHQAAYGWLRDNGFGAVGLDGERVFFEETRSQKIARLTALGCHTFVDDLPEVFCDPQFPPIKRLLFDVHATQTAHPQSGLWRAVSSWDEISSALGEGALSSR